MNKKKHYHFLYFVNRFNTFIQNMNCRCPMQVLSYCMCYSKFGREIHISQVEHKAGDKRGHNITNEKRREQQTLNLVWILIDPS